MNETDLGDSLMVMHTRIVSIVQIPIAFAGVVTNILLIVAHAKDPLKTLKTTSSPFILNIAAIDLASSFVCLTMSIAMLVSVTDYREREIQSGAIIRMIGHAFIAMSSLSFFSLSIERFCSVAFPLWHRVRITTRVCRYWLCAIWLFHTTFVALTWTLSLKDYLKTVLCIIGYMGLFFLLTQFFYLRTYFSLKNQRRKLLTEGNVCEAAARSIMIRLENEKNFLYTIAIVCSILAVSFLPFLLSGLLVQLSLEGKSYTLPKSPVLLPLYCTSLVLLATNFAINPFVYVWRIPKYRKTFKKLYLNWSN